jgi:SAM-dependent methyltransferase
MKDSPKSQPSPPRPQRLPHQNEAAIDSDPVREIGDEDGNSSLGGFGTISSTASLSSSILKFRQENGRTYHAYKDGVYIGPNDNPEQERLDFQHALCLLTFENQLYHCPAAKSDAYPVKRVLDVGTGTGCWAIDFADEHPEAHVIGVDLSPIQPSFVPPNVEFQVDDMEETWTFSAPFDFIHSRFMTASFADWPRFFKQCYDNLEPGGWLEVVDILPPTSDDATLTQQTALGRWSSTLLEGTRTIGRDFDGALHYNEQIQAAGFEDVKLMVYKWPQNRWPKDPKYKELGKPHFRRSFSDASIQMRKG